MINTKYWTPSILASIAVTLQLLTGGGLSTSAAEFTPPDNVGAPRGRVGGGTGVEVPLIKSLLERQDDGLEGVVGVVASPAMVQAIRR